MKIYYHHFQNYLAIVGFALICATASRAQPTITTQPQNCNTNVGANVSFTVVATGTGTLTYKWYYNNALQSNITLSTLTFNGVTINNSGTYYVQVGDNGGFTTSSNAVLNVGISNAFTTFAVPTLVTNGQNATFTAISKGSPVSYYWRSNGVFIPNATNSTYTITNATYPAYSGVTYMCLASNFLNTVASSALLTVYDPPTITKQPVGKTNSAGASFSLLVVAVGNPTTLHYQWRTNGISIPSATSATYSVSSAQTNQSATYDVVITNIVGSVTSNPVQVSVQYFSPVVTVQPVGTNVVLGNPFSLSATATGTAPLTWQWRNNSVPIPGATSTSYQVSSAQFTDAGGYDVVVSNIAGITNSIVAQVNVGNPPVITQQPSPATVNAGDTTNFSAQVSGTTPLALQWMLNGFAITNQTNLMITLTNAQTTNIGYYSLVATNLFGSATSSNAVLNLSGSNFFEWAGLEAHYPLNGTNTMDESGLGNDGTNFGGVAAGDRFGNAGGAMSFDGNQHYIQCKSGAYFGSNYTISAWVNPSAYNTYSRVMDFGNAGPGNNTDLALTAANSGDPYFEVYIGATQIGVCGTPPAQPFLFPLNQWTHVVGTCDGTNLSLYFNGVLRNRTTLALNRKPVNTIHNYIGKSNWADQYFFGSFEDIRLYGRELSAVEVTELFALEGDLPVITQQPLAQTANVGDTVTFSVTATDNHPITYQWRTNDVAIAGATNSSLILTNVQAAAAAFYSVTVSNVATGVASAGALLNFTGNNDPTWSGLVAYYPLNGNARDLSGNGYDGTNINATPTTDRFGNAGGALGFNGNGDYIQIPAGSYIGTNFTITAWVNETNYNQWSRILDYGNGPGVDNTLMAVSDATSGRPDLEVINGTTRVDADFDATYPVPVNTWTHVAATWDGTKICHYLNGVPNGSYIVALNRATPTTTLNYIGRSNYRVTSGDKDYAGSMSNVRVYNRTLSADEMAYLYQLEAQSTVSPPPVQTPVQLSASLSAGSNLNLQFTGTPGSGFVLQAATNLQTPILWLPIQTNTADTNGLCQFSDTNLAGSQKFYRVVTQ